MNPSSFPLLPQFLLFVFGIYLSFPTDWFSIGFGLALALVTLLYFAFQAPWYSRNLLIGSCFLLLGVGLGKIDQRLTKKYYSLFITTKGQNTFEFILQQRLRPTAYYDRYTIQIKKSNGQRADGHSLLILAKDSTQKPLDYDQVWKLSGRINPIAPPLNPGQFDYRSYLKSLGIYHQLKSTRLPTPLANQSTRNLFFSNLYLSKLSLLLCYLLLIGLLLGHYSKKSGWFYCNCSVALALFYSLWTGFPQKQDSLWLAHLYGGSLLVEKKQQQLFFYTNDSLAGKDFTLRQYQRYFGLKDKVILPLKNGYQLGQQQLLVIDGAWIEGYETSPASILLLCNNPKFNVERYLKIKNRKSY